MANYYVAAQKQLLGLVYGQGGSGKSEVLTAL